LIKNNYLSLGSNLFLISQKNDYLISALPPRDYENVSILSGIKKPISEAMLEEDEEGGAENDPESDRTFATIYRVTSKSELCAVDHPEVGEIALKDGFVFRRSEAIADAEGKEHKCLIWFKIFGQLFNTVHGNLIKPNSVKWLNILLIKKIILAGIVPGQL